MARAFAKIAFTGNVRRIQERMGSAKAYEKFLSEDAQGGDLIGPEEQAFIQARDGFYQATVSETGWPYVQFRGGPPGFLKVLDDRHIGYADYRGNRQYLSAGNLAGDARIALILMDYAHRRRLKLWGRARLLGADQAPDLIAALHDPEYRARPERAVIIRVEAMDWNCPTHIPQRLALHEIEGGFNALREEIAKLKTENDALRAALDASPAQDGP